MKLLVLARGLVLLSLWKIRLLCLLLRRSWAAEMLVSFSSFINNLEIGDPRSLNKPGTDSGRLLLHTAWSAIFYKSKIDTMEIS